MSAPMSLSDDAARILELIAARDSKSEQELRQIRQRLRRQFARGRGWSVSRKPFPLYRLLSKEQRQRWGYNRCEVRRRDPNFKHLLGLGHPFSDHAEHYWRKGQPIAVITHTYADPGRLFALTALGLEVNVLPWSWWYPGSTTAVLIQREEEEAIDDCRRT